MDCRLPGSSVYGIFQARTLEWVAISLSRGPSRPRDWTRVSCTVGRHSTIWTRLPCNSNGKESASLVASFASHLVKNPPAMLEIWVRSLGWEDPPEKGQATHSSILAWRSPWTEKPGGLQFMGSHRIGLDWVTKTHRVQGLRKTHVSHWLVHLAAPARFTQDGNCGDLRWLQLLPWRLYHLNLYNISFPGGSDSKESACNGETRVEYLGGEDPLEKGMATHSYFLPGESHGQRNRWATVHVVAKSKDTTEQLTLSYVNYRSIKLERERERERENTSLGKKKSIEEHFFVAYWFQARGKTASDSWISPPFSWNQFFVLNTCVWNT